MTHTTFARRRRKVAVLQRNIENLNAMNTLLKNWKTSLAGLVAIAGVVTATWLPQYSDEVAKVVGILAGLGLLAAKDGNQTGL